jgi:2-iminobutanoate/2-iminopropanoate deaminase
MERDTTPKKRASAGRRVPQRYSSKGELKREVIQTVNAPISKSPISQGVKFGNLIFTQGMTPRHPKSGELVDGDMHDVARLVLNNIKAILEAGGSLMQNVLQVRCFLRDFDDDFPAWDEVYREFFPSDWPARTVIPAPLGKNFRIEVDVVAGILNS